MAYTTIDDSSAYFQSKTYTGNGSDNHAITLDGNSNLQPDWVWIKCRSNSSYNHNLYDSVRGATKYIFSNSTGAEVTDALTLKSFNSDGFTLGTDASNLEVNDNTKTYVAWNWKAGTTSGIATNGSTTITPSAYSFNQTAGFSIIKYTGNSTSGAKIPHGLGVAPDVMIVKATNATYEWGVYHSSLGANKLIELQSTAAASTSSVLWNDTAPDSVNFTVQANNRTNTGSVYVGYMFAAKQGFSKFGSYIGNGNANGPFVYTGFKPAFTLFKKTSGTSEWFLYDNKRLGYNVTEKVIEANTSSAEDSNSATYIDYLSNGFKPRGTSGNTNASGSTYIYLAFAENPFVTSTGIPTTAR